MLLVTREAVAANREDLSRFVVHLTRDDTNDFKGGGGQSGLQNLVQIIKERRIGAFRAHCLHAKKLPKNLREEVLDSFNVACFTETPLSQIHLLTQPIEGLAYQREAYGVVFTKQSLIAAGAQPAIYVNSYGGKTAERKAFDEIFTDSMASNWADNRWRVLPFVNVMHERHDFVWEREWRLNRDFKFKSKDVVAFILPPDGCQELRTECESSGISCISPGWTYERIVLELSRQQRRTKIVLKKALADASQAKDGS